MYKIDLSCEKCKKSEKIIKGIRDDEMSFACEQCKEKSIDGIKELSDEKIIKLAHSRSHTDFALILFSVVSQAGMKESQQGFKFYANVEEMISGNKIRQMLEDIIDEKKTEMDLSDEKLSLLRRMCDEFKEWKTQGAEVVERVRSAVKIEEMK